MLMLIVQFVDGLYLWQAPTLSNYQAAQILRCPLA